MLSHEHVKHDQQIEIDGSPVVAESIHAWPIHALAIGRQAHGTLPYERPVIHQALTQRIIRLRHGLSPNLYARSANSITCSRSPASECPRCRIAPTTGTP